MTMSGISPLRDFVSLPDAMKRLFEDRWVSPGSWLTWSTVGTQYLPLDIYETADNLVVRALVPGVGVDGIDVQYQQGTLTLRTKASEPELENGATWLIHEIGGGQSIRQVTLPRHVDVEQAKTTLENGVLTLTLPKSADAKPKQIRVSPAPQIGAGATAA